METNPAGAMPASEAQAATQAQVATAQAANPQPGRQPGIQSGIQASPQTIVADNGTFGTGEPTPSQAAPLAAPPSQPSQPSQAWPQNVPQGTQGTGQSSSPTANPNPAPGASDQPDVEPGGGQEGDAAEAESQTDPANLPIRDWANAGVNTDGLDYDPQVWDSFGRQAVELGLTPRQVEALARWQLDTIAERKAAQDERGLNEIREEWGNNAGAWQSRCNSLVGRVDQALGATRFSRALDATGASSNPDIVRGLLVIANALGEDSGTTPAMNVIRPVTEDALAGLRAAYAQARAFRK